MEQIYLRPFARFMELADYYVATNVPVHVVHHNADRDQFPDEQPVEHLIGSAIWELQSFHRLFTRNPRIHIDETMVHRFFEHGFPNQSSRVRVFTWLLRLRMPELAPQLIANVTGDLAARTAARRMPRALNTYTRLERGLFKHYRAALLCERLPMLRLRFEPAYMDRLAISAVFDFLYSHCDNVVDPLPLRARTYVLQNPVDLIRQEIAVFVKHAGMDGTRQIVRQALELQNWQSPNITHHFNTTQLPELEDPDFAGHTYTNYFYDAVERHRINIINALRNVSSEE